VQLIQSVTSYELAYVSDRPVQYDHRHIVVCRIDDERIKCLPTVFEKDDPVAVELELVALTIDKALVSLHDALRAAQREGCELQFLLDAINDLPIPGVRISRGSREIWCGCEHIMSY
jgi:hypothetical protein